MNRFWLAFGILGGVAMAVSGCGENSSGDVGPLEGFVCGKDGSTYSVEDAVRGEHEVEHRGRCDAPMHCGSPEDCFVGDECMPADADGNWCIPGPTRCNCPGVFEPVCGGDSRNYINACEAACAGVGIRHEGYCQEPPGEGCVRAGCSGQLCVEEGMDIASTCEWRPVYECYQQASCERQKNGQCGFTPTHELVDCLERFGEGMCSVDPRWQDGFEAECSSPQVPGIVGVIAVEPHQMMHLGEWFGASFKLLEPPVFGDLYEGEGLIFCDGERTALQGRVRMTPLGDLEVECRILPEIHPGECYDDGDCAPGTFCEAGQCIANCPIETHILNFRGECVPKCYGPEQCGDEQHCNAGEVCLPDPACPECDVCVGWCEAPPDECRPTGCNGEICASQDVASPCVALPEFACYQEVGICAMQTWGQCGWTPTPELDECLSQFDCRAEGCADGAYCGYCWTSWECIPEGAVC